MIGRLTFLVIAWAAVAFLANRLYVILRYGELNVKGVVYSKAQTPVMYWAEIAMLVLGLTVIGGLALMITVYEASLFF
jgi:hypothetical protein